MSTSDLLGTPEEDSPIYTGYFDGEFLDEPPNKGIYKFGSYDNLEDRENYRPGGYHPVHLGDYFSNRYRVMHKLGNGGFATVWLCRDCEANKYIALKIMTAEASREDCADLELIKRDWDPKEVHEHHIAFPMNYFWIKGPNGKHLCLVLAVLGPRVSDIWRVVKDPSMASKNIALQVTKGLEFLHRNGICHGDFRPSNILLQLKDLDDLNEDELIQKLGEPITDPVTTSLGNDPEPMAPRYLVCPIVFKNIYPQFLTDQVSIIDFGESYPSSNPPENLGIPPAYCSPEFLFDKVAGIGCDIWALACTLFEIRTGRSLINTAFAEDEEQDSILQIVQFLGKPPEPWWSSWESRIYYLKEDGLPMSHSLEGCLAEELRFMLAGTTEWKVFQVPTDERKILANLLRQMLRYNPKDRITVKSVLEHKWFKNQSHN